MIKRDVDKMKEHLNELHEMRKQLNVEIRNTQKDINDYENTVLVFDLNVAKKLIKKGYVICNLLRNKKDKNKIIFVFKNEGDFEKDFKSIREEKNNVNY